MPVSSVPAPASPYPRDGAPVDNVPVKWYCNGMLTTIDKAGRVVIPAAVRERLGLRPGTPLDISTDDVSIHLEPVVSPPKLVRRKSGLLVARPTAPAHELPKIDVSALIDEERNRWPY